MKPIWWYVHKSPKPIRKIIQYICGKIGHTIGDTDYSADGLWSNCKYCNFYFKIPINEFPSKMYLKDIFESKGEPSDEKS